MPLWQFKRCRFRAYAAASGDSFRRIALLRKCGELPTSHRAARLFLDRVPMQLSTVFYGFSGCKGDMAVHGMEAERFHTSKLRPLAGPPAACRIGVR
jgi:hypothetical protein